MSLKTKILSFISAFVLMLSIMLIGVYAANQSISLSGNINFQISDKSLWVKDVRLSNNNYIEESIESFMPGYINGGFSLDFSTIDNQYSSFTLSFDIVNTTTTAYSVNLDYSGLSSITGLEITTSISQIPATNEEITEITSQTPATKLDIVIANPNTQTIDLSLIVISFEGQHGSTLNIINGSSFYDIYDFYYQINGGEQIEITEEGTINLYDAESIRFFVPGGETSYATLNISFSPKIHEDIYFSGQGLNGLGVAPTDTFIITQDVTITVVYEYVH